MAPAADQTAISSSGQARSAGWALRALGLAFGLVLFGYTLRDLDTAHLFSLVQTLGPLCLLILVPQLVGMALHTAAWKELLAARGGRASFFALAGVFTTSEAVRMALPAGPAIAESVAAYSLRTRFGTPWPRALASLGAKKAWVLCTHALCLLVLLAVGQSAFARLERAVAGGWALPWVTLGMAAMLGGAGALTLSLLTSRRAGDAAKRLLAKAPLPKIRAWANERNKAIHSDLSMPIGSHLFAGACLLGQWLSELAETWLVLRLLGLELSLAEVLVVELGGSLVRSLAFVIPGGIGVQDASYVALLVGLGIPGAEALAPAFVLLKRAKDVVFIALGLTLYAVERKRRATGAESAVATQTLVGNQT